MKAVKFPEMNTIWAKDQPEYNELPAYVDDQQTISLWALTWRERFRVLVTGRLWLRQLNFGKSLQPQLIEVDSPFTADEDDFIEIIPAPGSEGIVL